MSFGRYTAWDEDIDLVYLSRKLSASAMSNKWINAIIGLLAAVFAYMLVSGGRLGVAGVVTFVGTFAVVWLGLDYLTGKFRQGRTRRDLASDDAA